jgi:ABC-2 type transport system ATP-binding protein
MCLACTFIGDPSLVILEEPTVGLDLRFQRIFWNKLKQWKESKLIIVFTSNNNEAEAISDRIWYFQKAKIYNFF